MSYDDDGGGGRSRADSAGLSGGRDTPATHSLRLRLMMTNYRGGKTLGVLENKLLAASAMKRLGMPTMEIIYGALAYTSLGEWPVYKRRDCRPEVEAMRPALLPFPLRIGGTSQIRLSATGVGIDKPGLRSVLTPSGRCASHLLGSSRSLPG